MDTHSSRASVAPTTSSPDSRSSLPQRHSSAAKTQRCALRRYAEVFKLRQRTNPRGGFRESNAGPLRRTRARAHPVGVIWWLILLAWFVLVGYLPHASGKQADEIEDDAAHMYQN